MYSPWIRLASGRKFHFLRPHQSEIDIKDIAHNLSQLYRFTGACSKFYTIAEHCCHCSDMASDEHKLTALLHDAQEFALADVNSPLKSILPQYQELEARSEIAIAKKFGVPYPRPPIIKEIDLRMLVTEMRQLLKGDDWKKIPFEPYDFKIKCWGIKKSEREFLRRYHKYKN